MGQPLIRRQVFPEVFPVLSLKQFSLLQDDIQTLGTARNYALRSIFLLKIASRCLIGSTISYRSLKC